MSGGPRRFAPSTVAFAAVAVVVLVVVVLVAVKVTGGSNTPSTGQGLGPTDSPAPASLVKQVTSVPEKVFSTVGVPGSVQPPKVLKGETPLTAGGKPEVLYIGAEYCPYCAAERWALVVAFSRFGKFSNLQETTSSPWDVDPSTATFSFHGSTYSSNLVTFTTVENETNATGPNTNPKILQPLTSAQQSLWTKYSSQFGISTGYPFVDFGNKVFVVGPSYNPQVLQGLGQDAIAAKLSNPDDPVTQSIVGTANYLTAGICALTGQQPATVCSASATTDAAKPLGLS